MLEEDTPQVRNALLLADSQHAACVLVHDFINTTVRGIVERRIADPSVAVFSWTGSCHGALIRAGLWLRSLIKLTEPGDFQAIAAGSRALFEIALDSVLIIHQERRSYRKLMAWEESNQFKLASKLGESAPAAGDFIRLRGESVRAARAEYWPDSKGRGTHPMRWTGRDVVTDACVADQYGAPEAQPLRPSSFSAYARERYSRDCWYVHGSGVIALRGCAMEYVPTIVAQARRDAMRFALVSARCALTQVGCDDPITEARFVQLAADLYSIEKQTLDRLVDPSELPTG